MDVDAPEDVKAAANDMAMVEEVKDNRNVVDDNTAQKMKTADVEFLKEQNIGGKEIIDALIKNSNSFQDRTVFS